MPTTRSPEADPSADRDRRGPLIDLAGIDPSRPIADRAAIERVIPHRGDMLLLDAILAEDLERVAGVAVKRVRHDEFWVAGHFPGKPLFPGVLQIEAGAQLACYIYLRVKREQSLVAFLRLDDASFRAGIEPGDELILVASAVKVGRRNFVSDVQGLVRGRVAFDARVSGMMTPKVT